jgi:hypothetical protein
MDPSEKVDPAKRFILKGVRYFDPEEEAFETLEEAVGRAYWWIFGGMDGVGYAHPYTVEDPEGNVVLDEDALEEAIDKYGDEYEIRYQERKARLAP